MDAQSKTEKLLLDKLNEIGLNPQPQFSIDKMTVDFAFPDVKAVVEIDGYYHNSVRQREADGNRDDYLQSQGWKIRRFPAEEVYKNPLKVAYKIKYFIDRISEVNPIQEKAEVKNILQLQDLINKISEKSALLAGIILRVGIAFFIVGVVLSAFNKMPDKIGVRLLTILTFIWLFLIGTTIILRFLQWLIYSFLRNIILDVKRIIR